MRRIAKIIVLTAIVAILFTGCNQRPLAGVIGTYDCWNKDDDRNAYAPVHFTFDAGGVAKWGMSGIGGEIIKSGGFTTNADELKISWSLSASPDLEHGKAKRESWDQIERFKYEITSDGNLSLVTIYNSKAPLGKEADYRVNLMCFRQ